MSFSAHEVIFYIFAVLAVGSAFLVAVSPNPLDAAVALLLCLFSVAGLFAWAGAHFLAAMQVLVYAGAIVVLFVFVIMLLNLTPKELGRSDLGLAQWVGLGLVVVAMAGISAVAFNATPQFPLMPSGVNDPGSTARIGRTLVKEFVAPFEIVSLLLLAAMAGAVMLTRRDDKAERAIDTIQRIRAEIDARSRRAFEPDPLAPEQQGPPARQALPSTGPATGVEREILEPGDTV